MNNEALKTLVAQGLAAMKAGGKTAAAATSEIQNDARNADLKSALETGSRVSKQWAERIDQALREAGGGDGEQKNPVVKALYEVSRMIRQQAPDDMSRDLGIIANGQLALHYWIAAFGTMRAYASKLGMDRTASAMESCLKEAKEADEQHNGLAQRIMGA